MTVQPTLSAVPEASPFARAAHASEGPLPAYRKLVREGTIRPDSEQELAAEKLQSLWKALAGYRPETGRVGWKARLGLARRREEPPQGLYLFGGVGRGKSMLMDLFYLSAGVEEKRRVHFHAFMAEVHDRLHAWREKTRGAKADPLPDVAAEIAAESWLICFDEFQVVNIADAMILARLFEALFEAGAVVVATSNVAPGDLYKGGLQRERFLPFIDLLRQRLDVLQLDGGIDYRLDRIKDLATYHRPLDAAARAALDRAFARLIEGAEARPESLSVKGRRVTLPLAARGVARASFAALCEAALGASDYLAIARRFHTLVLDGVPQMGPRQRNEARRFIHLVDALYEHRCNLILSAEVEPEALYPEGDSSFEFQRTVSRLMEMQSRDYIDAPHLAGTEIGGQGNGV